MIPLTLGVGFLVRPKKVLQAQTRFRKRMEKMEKRLFKAHRATGLAFILLGLIMLLSWFYPIWIFNLFAVARLLAGLFFPRLFQSNIIQTVTQITWI